MKDQIINALRDGSNIEVELQSGVKLALITQNWGKTWDIKTQYGHTSQNDMSIHHVIHRIMQDSCLIRGWGVLVL